MDSGTRHIARIRNDSTLHSTLRGSAAQLLSLTIPFNVPPRRMVALTLSYFPIRARAEPMRVLLADAGVEFVDKRIPLDEEWKTTLKAQYPFRQLPTLDVQDEQGNVFCLPETNAILQYLEDTFTVIPGHKERSALDQAQTTAVREVRVSSIVSTFSLSFQGRAHVHRSLLGVLLGRGLYWRTRTHTDI